MTLMKKLEQQCSVSPRRVVIAQRRDIHRALSQGYSYKEIWRAFSSESPVPVSYPQFTRLVNRYVLLASRKPNTSSATETEIKARPKRTKSSSSFQWDPNINDDELY
jgi:hypothetical protein